MPNADSPAPERRATAAVSSVKPSADIDDVEHPSDAESDGRPDVQGKEQLAHPQGQSVIIIGAGPAGLTAAYELSKAGVASTVLEADDVVGGISRTVERDGWRFDIGGHRFFTKVREVDDLWHEILPNEEFLLRDRLSRIYYKGKFFDYPLRATNVLRNLGIAESVKSVGSYAWVRLRPPEDQSTFEGFVAGRFGWRLYRTFFKTYTEKVWGLPTTELQADFAAQRIKNLSFTNAVLDMLTPKAIKARQSGDKVITSLIERFKYPKLGPGMMWETCRDKVLAAGSQVVMNAPVDRIRWTPASGAISVDAEVDGLAKSYPATEVVSSMPLAELVLSMDPAPDDRTVQAARDLRFRDFLTVALVVPESAGFKDNWIYIHAPEVKVGRIQNFGSWSPYMVKGGRACLGLEYFVFEGDELWESADEDLIELGKTELGKLGLCRPEDVEAGYVVRMPKAYPTYDEAYTANVDILREWLASNTPNVHPVGRNGMHRYNNQDHSMLTAMLVADTIATGTPHDVWSVNVEAEYHEEGASTDGTPTGTGRSAPVTPRRVPAE